MQPSSRASRPTTVPPTASAGGTGGGDPPAPSAAVKPRGLAAEHAVRKAVQHL
jgi:hypothetical protein